MIIFEGNPSKEVRRFITRIIARILIITAIVVVAIVYVPYICYYLFNGMKLELSMFLNFFMILWLCGSFVFCVAMIIPMAKMNFPTRVTIENEYEDGFIENIYLDENQKSSYIEIRSITKVVDYGTFYYLRGPRRFFICQKDLLTQGTIEEFEELFKEMIRRKK